MFSALFGYYLYNTNSEFKKYADSIVNKKEKKETINIDLKTNDDKNYKVA